MRPKWRLTLEWVSSFLEDKGFKLLDTHYINNSTKMNVQCKEGHSFLREFSKFHKKITQCPICYANRPMKKKGDVLPPQKKEKTYKTLIEKILKHCKQKQYIYVNHTEKVVSVICKVGHSINKSHSSIFSKKYQCQKCAQIKTAHRCRTSLENIRILVQSREETLVGQEFPYPKKNLLKINCKNGHEYSVIYQNYKKGSGCPSCRFKNENIVRETIERITKKSFPKKRPDFLKYKNKKNLELDGYCEELNLAFEYDGEQHFYVFSDKGFGCENNFKAIQERDLFKTKKCNELGIKLLRVPYYIEDKEEYIKEWFALNKVLTD